MNGNDKKDDEKKSLFSRSAEEIIKEAGTIVDYESLLKEKNLEDVAEEILQASYGEFDIMKKDTMDRFLDYIYFKVQTGYWETPSMAYPTKRMNDRVLEGKIIEILNEHLYPDIVLKILKFFTRNIYDPDSNLYVANLIYSENIIRSLYDTYNLFKKDIFQGNKDKRSLNVKRIQQFSPRSDNKLSSPLDAAARLKYVLEFLAIKNKVDHIYTKESLALSRDL
ncbi:MAG: hypothetical protein CVV44_07345 [Spirochaetae bacterium HGW-Spirochaetae-1]|jgi:hypothetical protein|nr:MAG: hypothetical protein CVV44_07345 [Spirochaetae bacterium HGW-Spirochaetae-1]